MQHAGNMGSPMAMYHMGSGNTGSPMAMNNNSEMRPLEQSSSHRQAAMAASLHLRHQLHRGSPSPKKTPPPPALLPRTFETTSPQGSKQAN